MIGGGGGGVSHLIMTAWLALTSYEHLGVRLLGSVNTKMVGGGSLSLLHCHLVSLWTMTTDCSI